MAFFTAFLPPAFVAAGVGGIAEDQVNVALPLALAFWLLGFLSALWAAYPTLRYWDGLPPTTRWMGALPLLSVSLLLTVGLVAVLFV